MNDGAAYDDLEELYDLWCAEVTEDQTFYADLATALAKDLHKETLNIIELGAGSGRITKLLAEQGHHVTAIDASKEQLKRLRSTAQEMGLTDHITTVHGDMRELSKLASAVKADLVIAPFRSLLHVTRDRDHVFGEVHRVLQPNGVFAFDVFHASIDDQVSVNGQWIHRRNAVTPHGEWRFDEKATYSTGVLRAQPSHDDISHADTSDIVELKVEVRCTWLPYSNEEIHLPVNQHVHTALNLALAPAELWLESLIGCGFEIDGVYGWFDGKAFAPGDDDSVWVVRRA